MTVASVVPGTWSRYAAVGRVEPQGAHREAEQRLVHVPFDTLAVLVGLDLHQGRLGRSGQSGDRPGVRIGFLELQQRPVDGELAEVVEGAVVGQERRQGRPGRHPHEVPEHLGDPPGRVLLPVGSHCVGGGPPARGIRQRGQGHRLPRATKAEPQVLLEPSAHAQQGGLPLPLVRDPREPAVVKLVEAVEGEGAVLARQRVVVGFGGLAEGAHRAAEDVDEVGAERAAWLGQGGGAELGCTEERTVRDGLTPGARPVVRRAPPVPYVLPDRGRDGRHAATSPPPTRSTWARISGSEPVRWGARPRRSQVTPART